MSENYTCIYVDPNTRIRLEDVTRTLRDTPYIHVLIIVGVEQHIYSGPYDQLTEAIVKLVGSAEHIEEYVSAAQYTKTFGTDEGLRDALNTILSQFYLTINIIDLATGNRIV